MIKTIGLLDYDILRSHKYYTPNYDLGVTYAYLKQDVNNSVRLIGSLSSKNLKDYSKIYIFKQDKNMPHPSGYIQNYYQLPIEEYGEGFISKPLRPFQEETRFLMPDFTCYNPMLQFSIEHPNHNLAWHIDKNARGKKYKPLRLYECVEGEELKKDFPVDKYCMIFDDPTDILNNKEKWKYFNEFLDKGHKFLFSQSLDISRLSDTNILEQILSDKKYACLRKRLVASCLNDEVEQVVELFINQKTKKAVKIFVKLPIENSLEQCFECMLLMGYYYHKTGFRLHLVPMWDKPLLKPYLFALYAFNYLTHTPNLMSYYEYVANMAFIYNHVPRELIRTGEERYSYIMKQYGMPEMLCQLEDWIQSHPLFEEAVFIGGDSDYKQIRKEYYRKGKPGFDVRNPEL